jgi:hypothetical protein
LFLFIFTSFAVAAFGVANRETGVLAFAIAEG